MQATLARTPWASTPPVGSFARWSHNSSSYSMTNLEYHARLCHFNIGTFRSDYWKYYRERSMTDLLHFVAGTSWVSCFLSLLNIQVAERFMQRLCWLAPIAKIGCRSLKCFLGKHLKSGPSHQNIAVTHTMVWRAKGDLGSSCPNPALVQLFPGLAREMGGQPYHLDSILAPRRTMSLLLSSRVLFETSTTQTKSQSDFCKSGFLG